MAVVIGNVSGGNVVIGGGNVTINGKTYSGNVTIVNGQVVSGGGSGAVVEGNGQAEQEHRDLFAPFTSIDASGISELCVDCSRPNAGLEIRADSNILPHFDTVVEDGVLKIQPKDGISPRTPIAVTLFAESLEGLDLSGQVRAQVDHVKADEFELGLSGQSQAVVNGQASVVDVDVSGQSKAYLDQLSADKVRADVSGQSRAYVAANNKLSADVSGMSELNYLGSPTVKKDVSGMASLNSVSSVSQPGRLTPLQATQSQASGLVAGLAASLLGSTGPGIAETLSSVLLPGVALHKRV